MKNNLIREEINVKENKIGIIKFGNSEYISLTDLARYADEDDVSRNKLINTILQKYIEIRRK